jgi:hypothetical protein
MGNTLRTGFSLLAAVSLVGCSTEDLSRNDGLTFAAGNAIHANTVMQMVDPWQPGVQNTKLLIPADRTSKTTAAPAQKAAVTLEPSTMDK